MKYAKITALLGLAQLTLHSGVAGAMGLAKPVAKLTEEDLEKIENALNHDFETENAQLKADLETANKDKKEAEDKLTSMEGQVAEALQTAGLEGGEDALENINLLGEKCKEFGESKARHSFADNNGKDNEGKEKYIDGHIDPNDAHNQLINQLS